MLKRNRVIGALTAALTAAAVVRELRLPPESRTWHGRIFGVPYDFRPPTGERIRSKVWNKDNPSILSPTIFGVGWTVNLYRLANSGFRRS
jgi:hypothetical protein